MPITIRTKRNAVAGTDPATLAAGELAVNVADTPPTLFVGDGTNTLRVGPVAVASTAPTDPKVGVIWYDDVNNTITMWNGTAWIPMGSGGSGGGGLTIADTAPTAPAEGDLWMDSSSAGDFSTYAWYDDNGVNPRWVLQSDPNNATDTFVEKAGDTMTGPLNVPANATGTQVPREQEVVKIAGSTMTGLLTLSGAPTAANHAVTKTYADTLPFLSSDPTGVTGAAAITNIISLAQADYDAIGTKDPTTLYLIDA